MLMQGVHWTFSDAVCSLYIRFVRGGNARKAALLFKTIQFSRAQGVNGWYNELTRHARQMVQVPTEYDIAHQFYWGLPSNMRHYVRNTLQVRPETHSLLEILSAALLADENLHEDEEDTRISTQIAPRTNPTRTTDSRPQSSNNTISQSTGNQSGRSRGASARPNGSNGARDRSQRGSVRFGNRDARGDSTSSTRPTSTQNTPVSLQTDKGRNNDRGKSTDKSNVRCFKCGGTEHYSTDKICPDYGKQSLHMVAELVQDDAPAGASGSQGAEASDNVRSNEAPERDPDERLERLDEYLPNNGGEDEVLSYYEGSQYDQDEEYYEVEDDYAEQIQYFAPIHVANEADDVRFEDTISPIVILEDADDDPIEYNSSEGDSIEYVEQFDEDDDPIPTLTEDGVDSPAFLDPTHDVLAGVEGADGPPHEDVVELPEGIFHVSEFNLDMLFNSLPPQRFVQAVRRRLIRFREAIGQLRTRTYNAHRALEEIRDVNTRLRTSLERERGGGLPTIWTSDVTPPDHTLRDFQTRLEQLDYSHDRLLRVSRFQSEESNELRDELTLIQRVVGNPEWIEVTQRIVQNAIEHDGARLIAGFREMGNDFPDMHASIDITRDLVPPIPLTYDEDLALVMGLGDSSSTPGTTSVGRLAALSGEERAYRTTLHTNGVVKQCPKPRGRCMTFMVKINGLEALVLLDTGSTLNAISPDFARMSKAKVFELSNPLVLQLGCVGSRSKSNFGVETQLTIESQTHDLYFDVVNIDHYDVILGIPFLDLTQAVIDFGNYTIRSGRDVLPALKGEGTPTRRRINNIMHTFREAGRSS